MGAEAAIPPRSSRREERGCDRALCREHNRIERRSSWMKEFRGTAAG
jgi:transposase